MGMTDSEDFVCAIDGGRDEVESTTSRKSPARDSLTPGHLDTWTPWHSEHLGTAQLASFSRTDRRLNLHSSLAAALYDATMLPVKCSV
jgi:hypothetical protein